jgi:hypothetical protein
MPPVVVWTIRLGWRTVVRRSAMNPGGTVMTPTTFPDASSRCASSADMGTRSTFRETSRIVFATSNVWPAMETTGGRLSSSTKATRGFAFA